MFHLRINANIFTCVFNLKQYIFYVHSIFSVIIICTYDRRNGHSPSRANYNVLDLCCIRTKHAACVISNKAQHILINIKICIFICYYKTSVLLFIIYHKMYCFFNCKYVDIYIFLGRYFLCVHFP